MLETQTYPPFVLIDGRHRLLYMAENDMLEKQHIFYEHHYAGWEGNGFDWTSIAMVLIKEQMPDLEPLVEYESDMDTFSASGPLDALIRLGQAMKAIYHNEPRLKEIIQTVGPH